MKIALIGYGKMGKEIEQIALGRGHQVVVKIDIDNQQDFESEAFKNADVAIEFTAPSIAVENYNKCFKAHLPVVSGTTGWTDCFEEIAERVNKEGQSFFWSSNFSIGVNIFAAINRQLAKIMNRYPNYDVEMKEVHHTQKLDAPSGTAITLAEDILTNLDRKTNWVKEKENTKEELAILSERRGQVPGIHTIKYESDADLITITHDAKSRKGFALGVVLAAEFIEGKKGVYGMKDLLSF